MGIWPKNIFDQDVPENPEMRHMDVIALLGSLRAWKVDYACEIKYWLVLLNKLKIEHIYQIIWQKPVSYYLIMFLFVNLQIL